jgi:cell division protein FtsB
MTEEEKDKEIKRLHETIDLSVDALHKNMAILGSLYTKIEALEAKNAELEQRVKDLKEKLS